MKKKEKFQKLLIFFLLPSSSRVLSRLSGQRQIISTKTHQEAMPKQRREKDQRMGREAKEEKPSYPIGVIAK